MKIDLTIKASKIYKKLSIDIKKALKKQMFLLETDLRHPSLRAKKYDEAGGVWQARINDDWRFYFVIEKDIITLIHISKHPK